VFWSALAAVVFWFALVAVAFWFALVVWVCELGAGLACWSEAGVLACWSEVGALEDIAGAFGFAHPYLYEMWRKFKAEGVAGLVNKHWGGAPVKIARRWPRIVQ
jgi:hypothetical protein